MFFYVFVHLKSMIFLIERTNICKKYTNTNLHNLYEINSKNAKDSNNTIPINKKKLYIIHCKAILQHQFPINQITT